MCYLWTGVTSYSLHPGSVQTDLLRYLPAFIRLPLWSIGHFFFKVRHHSLSLLAFVLEYLESQVQAVFMGILLQGWIFNLQRWACLSLYWAGNVMSVYKNLSQSLGWICYPEFWYKYLFLYIRNFSYSDDITMITCNFFLLLLIMKYHLNIIPEHCSFDSSQILTWKSYEKHLIDFFFVSMILPYNDTKTWH